MSPEEREAWLVDVLTNRIAFVLHHIDNDWADGAVEIVDVPFETINKAQKLAAALLKVELRNDRVLTQLVNRVAEYSYVAGKGVWRGKPLPKK